MRNISSKTKISLFLSIIFFLFITSCKGFFNDNNLDEKIRAAIDYAKAKNCTLLIKADSQYGEFLSDGEKQCKINNTIDIQFTVYIDSYIYKGMEAVNRRDQSVNMNDYVEFSEEGTDVEHSLGIYKVRVKLLKETDDILIRPVCLLIPKVVDIYPPFTSMGYDQDTTIKITFNKSVDTTSFTDYNWIQIKSSGDSLNSFYGSPYFTADNTVLNIPTIKGMYIIPIENAGQTNQNNQTTKDLLITVNTNGLKDTDQMDFNPCEEHSFRINKNVDNTKPVITELHVFSGNDSSAYFYKELTSKPLSQWSSEKVLNDDGSTKFLNGDYSQNHVSKLYVTVSGYDRESGIRALRIKEILNAGSETSEKIYEEEFENFSRLQKDGDTICSLEFPWEFNSEEDGMLLMSFALVDTVGNENVQTYYVIKDSFSVCETPNTFTLRANSSPKFHEATYNSETGKYEYTADVWDKVQFPTDKYFENYYSQQLYSVQILEDGEYTTIIDRQSYSNNGFITNSLTHSLFSKCKIDPDKDTYMRVIIEEESGLSGYVENYFPKRISVTNLRQQRMLNSTTLIPYNDSSDLNTSVLYYYKYESPDGNLDDNYTSISINQTFGHITTSFNGEGTYYIYAIAGHAITAQFIFYSCVGKPYVYKVSDTLRDDVVFPTLQLPDWRDIKFEQNSKTAKLNFNIVFDENITYEDFDYDIYAVRQDRQHDVKFSFSTSTTEMEVANKYKYDVFLVAKDKQTGVIIAEGEKQSLDLTHRVDNYPPYFYPSGPKLEQTYNGLRIPLDTLYDYTDAETKPKNITSIKYWTIPKKYSQKQSYEFVLNNYIAEGTAAVDYDLGYFELPFSKINKEPCYIYFYVEDNSSLKNYYFGASFGFVNYEIREYTPEIDKENKTNFHVELTSNTDETLHSLSVLYLDNNEWKESNVINVAMTRTSDTDPPYYSCGYEDLGFANTFARLIVHGMNSYQDIWAAKTVYVCPDYYRYKGTAQAMNLDNATWLKVDNGYQIFCDAPCFVHTMYSQDPVTLTNTTADATEWETYATETGLVGSDGSAFTYRDSNLSEIPEGYYYATIIHFADGSILMSEIKQK